VKHVKLAFLVSLLPSFVQAEQTSVLGKAGDIEITSQELRESIAGMESGSSADLTKDAEALSQYARALLVRRLVLREALEKKWDQEPAVITKLVRAREAALAESYLDAASATEKSYPTEAQVKEAYDVNRAKFVIPKSFRLAQIYINTATGPENATAKAKLATIQKQLAAKGADFEVIAKSSSDDPASAAQGGEIGWLTEDQIQPEIRLKLPKLTLNKISDPILLKDGWHILKVLDIREARTPTLDEIRDNLVTNLKAEQSRINRQQFIAELLKKHPLAINEIELTKLLQQP
jgi:parvulin-like peptidyl-prolyl isomerase